MPTRSPFTKFANAELVFPVEGKKVETDPITGNEIPKPESVKVTALLEPSQKTASNKVIEQVGANRAVELLEGYLVNPLELPVGIVPGMKANATLTVSKSVKRQGKVMLLPPVVNDPYAVGAGIDVINQITVAFWSLD